MDLKEITIAEHLKSYGYKTGTNRKMASGSDNGSWAFRSRV
ncbi:MAG: hypothetical protein CM15mP32_2410 [Flavobacteriaceae bacterium]|nr:MAG: hypothetical protein CM15mP32_2410 [Flavobacteriaceae bacterium]